MRYTLRRLVSGEPTFIEISSDEFTILKSTQEKLLVVLNIELTFDLLLENYAEFERDFLGLGLRLSLFREHGQPLEPHREMNRRIANLLSSARFYSNQILHALNSIYGRGSEPATVFEQCCSKQYESSLAYRIMEALRNYAQHRGLPVHAMILAFEREDSKPGSPFRVGLRLFVEIQYLKEDRRFKKQVFDELTAIADKGHIDLMPLVREYMERLCKVHESIRSRISADVASWDQTIISALGRARAAFGEDLSGLSCVLEETEEEDHQEYYRVIDSADIHSQLIDWRKSLEAKNRDFGRLSARYVVGHIGSRRHT